MFFLDEDINSFNPIEPFKNMYWDFISTFHPYKTMRGFFLNLLQPLLGLQTILKGLLTFSAGLIALFTVAPLLSYFWRSSGDVVLPFLYTGALMLNGLANMTRGLSQVVFSPLTLAIKIPFRLFLSLIYINNSNFLIENRSSTNKLCSKAYSHPKYCEKLHDRYRKGLARGESTNIDQNTEGKTFKGAEYDWTGNHGNGCYSGSKNDLANYARLFTPSYSEKTSKKSNAINTQWSYKTFR